MALSPSSSATLNAFACDPASFTSPRRRSDCPHVSGPEFVKQWRRDVAMHAVSRDDTNSPVRFKPSPREPLARHKSARGCQSLPLKPLRDFSLACWRRLFRPHAKARNSGVDAQTLGSASEHSWQVWTGFTPLSSANEGDHVP